LKKFRTILPFNARITLDRPSCGESARRLKIIDSVRKSNLPANLFDEAVKEGEESHALEHQEARKAEFAKYTKLNEQLGRQMDDGAFCVVCMEEVCVCDAKEYLSKRRTNSPLEFRVVILLKILNFISQRLWNLQVANTALCHGDTSHICCCLECARLLYAKRDPCPMCRQSVDNIVEVFPSICSPPQRFEESHPDLAGLAKEDPKEVKEAYQQWPSIFREYYPREYKHLNGRDIGPRNMSKHEETVDEDIQIPRLFAFVTLRDNVVCFAPCSKAPSLPNLLAALEDKRDRKDSEFAFPDERQIDHRMEEEESRREELSIGRKSDKIERTDSMDPMEVDLQTLPDVEQSNLDLSEFNWEDFDSASEVSDAETFAQKSVISKSTGISSGHTDKELTSSSVTDNTQAKEETYSNRMRPLSGSLSSGVRLIGWLSQRENVLHVEAPFRGVIPLRNENGEAVALYVTISSQFSHKQAFNVNFSARF